MPHPASWRPVSPSAKREAATMRRDTPLRSAARRARRASDGPILPPAPSTSRSPSRPRRKAQSASEGRESSSSRPGIEVINRYLGRSIWKPVAASV